MKHLPRKLARIAAVAAAETDSFVALARHAGLNPARAFNGANLRGVDFGTDDIAGFNFIGASLEGADLSRVTGYQPAMVKGASFDSTTRWPTQGHPITAIEIATGEATLGSPEFGAISPPHGFDPTRVRDLILARHLPPTDWVPFIHVLDLGRSRIRVLTRVAELNALQHLGLERTRVVDLSLLASLTNLQSLNLTRTQVTDLTPLAALANLQSLNLRYTQVTDLTLLAALANLQSLHLTRTQVTDLTPITALPKLKHLYLSGLPTGIEATLPRRNEIEIRRYR